MRTQTQTIRYLDKPIGELRQDRIFVTHRDESHIFRMYNGIGMSYDIIKKLKDLRCRKIIILLHWNNGVTEKLETYPDKFLDEGILWKDGSYDYQRILPLDKIRQKTILEIKR